MNEIAVLTAQADGSVGTDWLADQRDVVRATVTGTGALLIRGLSIRDAEEFAAAAAAVADELMAEVEPFGPRTTYPNGVQSATVWPADQPMCMHHELSCAIRPPALQMFGCLTAPASGGAVTLADGAAVLSDLPDTLVTRADRYGWQLTRNHNDIVGLSWREAFGIDTSAEVERYCRDNGIYCEWNANGGLRTMRTRPAIRSHPATGDQVWFNELAFLNEWTMEPTVREYLIAELGPAGLPFNTRYGDGTPLDRATVDMINDVYAAHTVRVPIQAGDLLVVDNLRTAHGREPYTGPRAVVVALADAALRSAQHSTDWPAGRR